MANLFLWAAVVLLLHTYFFYPLALVVIDRLARVFGRGKGTVGSVADRLWPQVTVIIAAYNEAGSIEGKIANTLALDYPRERLEVIVGSDGSTDGTDEIVARCTDKRVRLSRGERTGKTGVLNRCAELASGKILVFSDANAHLEPGALKALARRFDDPQVGAVAGRLRLFNPSKSEFEESAYWRYESVIREYEGRRGAVMGASGSLHGVRRALFTPLPMNTIVDDFMIPMRALAHGYRVVYEPTAVAREATTESYEREFARRVRIAAGNFQCLRHLVPAFSTPSFAAFAFWSHKVVRWLAPALMVTALVANAFLIESVPYRLLLCAQLGFYGLAMLGQRGLPAWTGPLRRLASVAYYFVVMNLAIAAGFWRFVRRAQGATWERTKRAFPVAA